MNQILQSVFTIILFFIAIGVIAQPMAEPCGSIYNDCDCVNPTFDDCPFNPGGADICSNAPLLSICQLDGWGSETGLAPGGGFFTDESFDPNSGISDTGWCTGGFSIENNQWISFIAEETSYQILGLIGSCSANSGIQMGVYEQSPIPTQCVGTQVFCQAGQSGGNTTSFFNVTGLVVGELYYIMIDGFGGDSCPFFLDIPVLEEDPVEALPSANFPICAGQPSAGALSGLSSPFTNTMTFSWETTGGNILSGADTPFPVIDQPGIYTLTIFDIATGCGNQAEVEVLEVTNFPEAVADVDGTITCDATATISPAGSTGLPGGSGYIYQWFGPDNENQVFHQGPELEVEVTEPGEYFLTIVDLSTGCLALEFASVVVPIDTVSPVAEPMVDGIIGCANSEINLLGNGPNFTGYAWEGPDGFSSTEADPLVDAGGEYTVTITAPGNGCTTSATVEVPVDFEEPGVMATGGTIDCQNLSINIEATSMTADVTFDWTGATFSDTGGSVIVDAADTYTVVATGANGCTSTATAIVENEVLLPTVTADVTGTLDCNTMELMLDGGSDVSNATYEWTDPNGMGITGEDPMISDAGTYTLTVTNVDNNCTETAMITVDEDIIPPSVTATTDDVLDCVTMQVPLQGSSTDTSPNFDWIGPNSFSDNTATPAASDPGTYTLTVTGANGCTATTTVEVTEDMVDPIADAGTDGLITCTQTMTTLDGSGSSTGDVSYEWINPSGSVESTTIDPTISSAGTYTLLVTNNTNGCTATDDVLIDTDEDIPMADAGMIQALDCNVTEVTLNGSGSSQDANLTYTWTNSGGTVVGTDLNAVTSTADTYTLTVNNPDNGCSAQASVTVSQDITDPVADAGLPQILNCEDTNLVLSAAGSSSNNPISYAWSDANGVFSQTETASVTEPGTYTVLVVDEVNGCEDISTVTITQDIAEPVASAGDPATITCIEVTATLDGSASTGDNLVYAWTNAAGDIISTDATTPTMVEGTFELLVTNSVNMCTSTAQVVIDIDADFPTVDVGDPTLLTCDVLNAILDGSNSNGGLSGGTNLAYEWQDASGATVSSTAIADITAPGTYTLVVSNLDNDCTAQANLEIPQNITDPQSDAGTDQTITCDVTEVSLDGSASSSNGDFSYEWTNEGSVSLGTATALTVSSPGTYTLLVTDTDNGCTATSSVAVVPDENIPDALVNLNGILTCDNLEVVLDNTGSSTGGTITYEWTDAQGTDLGVTTNTTVTTPGVYSLLVTNTDNGCSNTASLQVEQDIVPPLADAGMDDILTCAITSVQLDGGNSSATDATLSYAWSDGSTAATTAVTAAGDYILTVTNMVNGCTAMDMVTITPDENAPIPDAGAAQILTCATTSVSLDASASTGIGTLTYEWQASDGSMVASEVTSDVSTPDVYTVIVTDASNGCTASTPVEITQNITDPTPQIEDPNTLSCTTLSIDLSASNSVGNQLTYEWLEANGMALGTNETQAITEAGDYTLIVTDNENGCTAEASTTVPTDEVLPIVLPSVDGILTCAMENLEINSMGSSIGSEFVYEWTDPDGNTLNTDPTTIVDSPGFYTLQITNTTNGCVETSSVEVSQDIMDPTADAGTDDILTCVVTSVSLNGTNSTAVNGDLSYEWLNENTISIATAATTDVSESGTYTLIVTDTDNGCTNTSTVNITPDENLPTAIAGMQQTLTCALTEAQLDGSNSISSGGNVLTYEWQASDGSMISSTAATEVTSPDTYTLIVTDTDNGCSANSIVLIEQEITAPMPAIENPDMLTCTVTSVDLNSSSSSINGDVVFEWQNSNGVLVGNTASIPVTEAGIYNLVVTDNANGCTAITSTEVLPDENLPTALAQVDDILTCIIEDVTLSNTGSSTGSNFSYDWQDANGQSIATGATTTVSEPGTYTLVVSDSENGCMSEISTEVVQNTNDPQAIIEENSPLLTCEMESVVLNGSASLPTGNVSYAWQDGTGTMISNMPIPEVSQSDTYILVVTDLVNGCTNVSSIFVPQNEDVPVVVLPTPNVLTCTDSTVNLLSTGSSTGDFSYMWSTGETTESIAVTEAGTYQLTIVNNLNGCDNDETIEVTANQVAPNAEASVGDVLDCITPDVLISGAGSSTGNEFDYAWDGPGNINTPTAIETDVDAAGTYNLLVTNTENGCTTISSVDVDENTNQPNTGLIGTDDPDCFGDANGIVTVDEIIGGTAPYLYAFNGGALSPTTNFGNLTAGTYDLAVEDASGCTWDTTLVLVDPIVIDVDLGEDIAVQLGETVELVADVNIGVSLIEWEGADSLSCLDTICITQTLTPTQSGLYSITAYDENGCLDTDEIFLRVEINRPIYVPNAFSPYDENGINDGFTVFTDLDLKIVKEIKSLTVVNRWGEIVFQKYGFQPNVESEGWDGLFQGKELDPQMLVWYSEVEFIDGVLTLYKGDVTIMK